MSITIYKYSSPNTVRATIKPDSSSQLQKGLMREDIIVLNFSVTDPIAFQIGDYCYFFDVLYQINARPKVTRNADRNITYNIQLESEMYDLGKVQFLFLDQTNERFTESIFPLRGRLQDFGDLIIYNMKRVYPLADWKLGLVEETDYVELEFSAQNCLQALQTVVEAFDTEYVIDGKTINLYRRQEASNILLEYGFEKPLLSLTESRQDQSNLITRLYAYGSTKNIPNNYRDSTKRLRMDKDYLEKNVKQYRIFEFTKIFDGTNGTTEIYPHRTGTVSYVDDPFNFRDDQLDFNPLNYLQPGVSAKVVFNTGLLSGYTFDIVENGFDPATKKITIKKAESETVIDAPSASYTPKVGDQYVFIDIYMPPSYVAQAEADLKAAAQDFLNKNSIPPVAYNVTLNAKFLKDKNITFKLGQSIGILDEPLGINRTIRISSLTRNLNNPYLYSMELSETVKPKSLIIKLLNGI